MTHSVNSITALHTGFSSVISLSDLGLAVNLGVTDDERDVKQNINISFKFFFKAVPEGFKTDEINDTICYHQISEIVRKFCNNGKFKLLEYMCNGLYEEVRKSAPSDVKIWIRIEKCSY
jgi:FolB domain-containing protein